MGENGLAAQQRGGQQDMLREVVAMLMQGATPEQLMQQGVPRELIQAAMQVITEQQQPSPEQSGLAGSALS